MARTPAGVLLLDTGLEKADEETEDWYRPRRAMIEDALRTVGLAVGDVDLVISCHLHLDHIGGNPALGGRPIFCQHPDARARGRTSMVVVECEDGSIVLAGQAYDLASQWSADVLAARAPNLGAEPPLPRPSRWMDRLLQFNPRRVVFAHDHAVWSP